MSRFRTETITDRDIVVLCESTLNVGNGMYGFSACHTVIEMFQPVPATVTWKLATQSASEMMRLWFQERPVSEWMAWPNGLMRLWLEEMRGCIRSAWFVI